MFDSKTGPRLNPLAVFSLLVAGSIVIWFVSPAEWLLEWRVINRADTVMLLKGMALAWISFAAGCLIAWYFLQPRFEIFAEKESRHILYMMICCGLAVSAFGVVLVLTITQRGFGEILANIQGAGRPYYVTGVTTFVHLSTTGVLLYGVFRVFKPRWARVESKRLVTMLGVTLLGVAVARGVIGAERVAIYIPVVAVLICYVIMNRPAIARMAKFGVVALVAVISLFVLLESQRSYAIKYDRGDTSENALVYGFKRFVLYYTLALNTATTRIEYSEQGIMKAPLFTTTAYPLARVVYETTGYGTQVDIDFMGFEQLGQTEGVYNAEFTNISGLLAPFIEGWAVGVFFWVFWGGTAMFFYIRAYRQGATGYDVATYALILTAFCDAPRVNLLGATHFLFPFLFLLVFRLIGPVQMLLHKPLMMRRGGKTPGARTNYS